MNIDELKISARKYRSFKEYLSDKVDDFILEYIFFAFDDEQLEKEIKNRGFRAEDIVDLSLGSYCHIKDYETVVKFFEQLCVEEMSYFKTSMDFYGAFYVGLCEVEYCKSGDVLKVLDNINFRESALEKNPQYREVIDFYMKEVKEEKK